MAPSLLGSANLVAEVDRPLLLTRGVEPQCGVTPWLRKLDRSGALPKSIFEHCVSPSPPGKRARLGAPRVGRVSKSDRSSGAVHLSQVAGGSHRPTRGERISVRAHVWTNPGCSWDGERASLEGSFIGGARLGKGRVYKQAWRDDLRVRWSAWVALQAKRHEK